MKSYFFKTLMIVATLLFSSLANAGYITITDWKINLEGTGEEGAVSLDTLSVAGYTYVENDTTNGTFKASGYLTASSGKYLKSGNLDNTVNLTKTIVATFTDWTGSYSSSGSSEFTYTSGDTSLYVDYDTTTGTGTPILSISIDQDISSNGDLSSQDATSGNATGALNIVFDITDVAAGYFYVYVDGEWQDLADVLALANANGDTVLSYLNVLDTVINDSTTDTNTIVDNIKDTTGVTVDLSGSNKLIYTSGSYSLKSDVPEPGTLGLMGLAFLGLAGFQCKRKSSKSVYSDLETA